MKLLICNSNMFVPIVLSSVLENADKQYIVYTDQEGIYKLFNEFELHNAITLRYHKSTNSKPRDIKKAILLQLGQYQIEDITFYHTEFGEYANWLILKLSNKVKIYFQPPYQPWAIKPSYDFLSLKLKLVTYLTFGYNPDILLVGTKRYISMPKSFYKNNDVERIDCQINNQLIFDFIKKRYSFGDITGIVWLDGAIKAGGIDPTGYEELSNEIIRRAGKERFYSKCHPRFNDLYGLEKEIKEIPSYIPVSLLLECFSCFIGYWSTGLVEAAKAGKKAISTIYIMPQTQPGRIEIEKQVLDEKLAGQGVIYYPKTIDKLIEIISK